MSAQLNIFRKIMQTTLTEKNPVYKFLINDGSLPGIICFGPCLQFLKAAIMLIVGLLPSTTESCMADATGVPTPACSIVSDQVYQ